MRTIWPVLIPIARMAPYSFILAETLIAMLFTTLKTAIRAITARAGFP